MRAGANTQLAEGRAKESGAVRIGLLGGFSVVGERSAASFIGTSIHRLSSQSANLQKLATRSLHAGDSKKYCN